MLLLCDVFLVGLYLYVSYKAKTERGDHYENS